MSSLCPLLRAGCANRSWQHHIAPYAAKRGSARALGTAPILRSGFRPTSSASFSAATTTAAAPMRRTMGVSAAWPCRGGRDPSLGPLRILCPPRPQLRGGLRAPPTTRLHTLSRLGSAVGGRPNATSPPGPFGATRASFLLGPMRLRAPLSLHLGSASHLTSWQSAPPGRPPRNRLTAGLGAVGGGLVLLAGKGKYLLGALKLTKFASLGSMLLTVGTYSMFFGLPYAAGMVGLILVHESGHALVMRRLGIPFSPMVFVPFVGASVMMKRSPRDAYEEALVAFGGPVLGSMGALGVAGAGFAADSQLLYALADFGYMINLFNLLPIGMMDGGRICGALSPYAGVAGLGIGGALAYNGAVTNPIFYLILLAGGYQTFMRFYRPDSVPLNYYRITPAQRMAITGGYFGLVAAIFAAAAVNSQYKKRPEVLQRERELGIYRYD